MTYDVFSERLTRTQSINLDPSSHLATTDMGQKWGLCPFGGGDLGPHLTQCDQGQGLPACQVSSWCVQPFGHITPTLQTRQDRQRSDSTGWTILQTVAQKIPHGLVQMLNNQMAWPAGCRQTLKITASIAHGVPKQCQTIQIGSTCINSSLFHRCQFYAAKKTA